MVIPSILWSDKKEWTKEELLNQLKPMCKFSSDDLIKKMRLRFHTDKKINFVDYGLKPKFLIITKSIWEDFMEFF